DHPGDRAARGGQGHRDLDGPVLGDLDVVDEAEVVDVERDLRIEDRPERLDDLLAQGLAVDGARDRRAAAAEGLLHLRGGGRGLAEHAERHARPVLAGGDLVDLEVLDVVGHIPHHSVVTGSPDPSSAAVSVCHASVAHFTRIGNSATPAKAASVSRTSSSGSVSPFTIDRNAPKRSRASRTVLPLSASVIVEALAVEIAQPAPWKPMSAITSPSTTTFTLILSPQSGL